jgi:hypothetical protein
MDRLDLPGHSRNLWRYRAAMRSDESPITERHVTGLAGSMAGPGTTVRRGGDRQESVGLS